MLKHEIEKLDELGLSFAASLVRIAHLDLQMRLCGMTENDIDVLSFAAMIVANETAARAEMQQEPSPNDNSITKTSRK